MSKKWHQVINHLLHIDVKNVLTTIYLSYYMSFIFKKFNLTYS